MDHLEQFGLSKDAFAVASDLGFFVESDARARIRARLRRGVAQAKGLTLLYGEAGTGKTLLARKILDDLDAARFDSILMVLLPGTSGATDVLQRYARQLGVQDIPSERVPLLAEIYDALCSIRNAGRRAVLILDDVQLLSADALEALASLMALESEAHRLLSMLLVGNMEVAERIAGEPALSQRVDIRVRLKPLAPEDLAGYLARRCKHGGDPAEVLPEALVELVFRWTGGRPRAINTVLDNAFFEAHLAGRGQLLAADIERAAGDLGLQPKDPANVSAAMDSGALAFEEPFFETAPGADMEPGGPLRSAGRTYDIDRDRNVDLALSEAPCTDDDALKADLEQSDFNLDPAREGGLGWELGEDEILDLGEPLDELRVFDD